MSDKTLSIEITGIHLEIDKKTNDYIRKKVTKLVDYIPKHARAAAFVGVRVTEINRKDNNKYECEAVLTLPSKQLVAKDAAPNVLAAVDIVEAKLRGQIRRYKTEQLPRGRLMSRVRGVLRRRK